MVATRSKLEPPHSPCKAGDNKSSRETRTVIKSSVRRFGTYCIIWNAQSTEFGILGAGGGRSRNGIIPVGDRLGLPGWRGFHGQCW